MNKAIITVGSVTTAIRARRLLQKINVQSRLVKVDPEKSEMGCTHGIEFSEEHFYTVVMELACNDIPYRLYKE